MARSISVEHDGKTYSASVARIDSTAFGYEAHGILTAMLHCSGDGWGIGVGGFCLDRSTGAPDYRREGTAYGLDHLMRLMHTVGVDSWEKVPGREVLVLFPEGSAAWGGTAVGVAHISDEKRVLILKDHAESWRAREESQVSA